MKPLVEHFLDRAQDDVVIGGLDEHPGDAMGLRKLLRILPGEVGGIEDDRKVGGARIRAQLAREHVAVHAGHQHVGDDEVGRLGARALERLARVGGLAYAVPGDLEQRRERFAVRAIIVNDQDVGHA